MKTILRLTLLFGLVALFALAISPATVNAAWGDFGGSGSGRWRAEVFACTDGLILEVGRTIDDQINSGTGEIRTEVAVDLWLVPEISEAVLLKTVVVPIPELGVAVDMDGNPIKYYGKAYVRFDSPLLAGETIIPAFDGQDLDLSDPITLTTECVLFEDLLENGGFEVDSNSDKIPDGWSGDLLSKDKIKCNKNVGTEDEKIFSLSGDCAFMFKAVQPERGKLSQTVAPSGLGDGEYLLFTANVNKSNLSNGLRMRVTIKYAGEEKTSAKVQTYVVSGAGNGEYEPLNMWIPVTGDVAEVTVMLQWKLDAATGKAFFDDVQLTRIFGLGGGTTGAPALINTIPLPEPVYAP